MAKSLIKILKRFFGGETNSVSSVQHDNSQRKSKQTTPIENLEDVSESRVVKEKSNHLNSKKPEQKLRFVLKKKRSTPKKYTKQSKGKKTPSKNITANARYKFILKKKPKSKGKKIKQSQELGLRKGASQGIAYKTVANQKSSAENVAQDVKRKIPSNRKPISKPWAKAKPVAGKTKPKIKKAVVVRPKATLKPSGKAKPVAGKTKREIKKAVVVKPKATLKPAGKAKPLAGKTKPKIKKAVVVKSKATLKPSTNAKPVAGKTKQKIKKAALVNPKVPAKPSEKAKAAGKKVVPKNTTKKIASSSQSASKKLQSIAKKKSALPTSGLKAAKASIKAKSVNFQSEAAKKTINTVDDKFSSEDFAQLLQATVQDLVRLAKDQGYLTYEDLDDRLPRILRDSKHIISITKKLGCEEIEIIDSSDVDHIKETPKQDEGEEKREGKADTKITPFENYSNLSSNEISCSEISCENVSSTPSATAQPAVDEDTVFLQSAPVKIGDSQNFQASFPQLSVLAIENLHLGSRAAVFFQEKNVDTIGGFLRLTESWVLLIRERNTGRKTVDEMMASRAALIQSVRGDGSCDWIQYARLRGFFILPDKGELQLGQLSMKEFISTIRKAVQIQFNENQSENSIARDILEDRILKQYDRKSTLENLAIKHSVTRELIRQNEQEIVGVLRSSLLHGKYSLKLESKTKARYRTIKFRFLPEIEQIFKTACEVVSNEKNANASFSRRIEKFSEATGFSSSEVNEYSDFLSDILGLALNPQACAGTENIELVKTVLDSAESILKQKQVRIHFEDIYREVCNRLPGLVADPKWFYSKIYRDKRFQSIGRTGYWVLKEWNLQTGPIFDCLTKILKDAEEPLPLRQIIFEVQKMNPCKPATIQNTLQNRSEIFIKLPGNKYDLRERYPNRNKTDDEF
jgi:hypothetical protein